MRVLLTTLESKAGESLTMMIDTRSVACESDGEAYFKSYEFKVSRTTVLKDPVQFNNIVFNTGIQTSGSKLTATSVSDEGVLSTPIESRQANDEPSILPNSRQRRDDFSTFHLPSYQADPRAYHRL